MGGTVTGLRCLRLVLPGSASSPRRAGSRRLDSSGRRGSCGACQRPPDVRSGGLWPRFWSVSSNAFCVRGGCRLPDTGVMGESVGLVTWRYVQRMPVADSCSRRFSGSVAARECWLPLMPRTRLPSSSTFAAAGTRFSAPPSRNPTGSPESCRRCRWTGVVVHRGASGVRRCVPRLRGDRQCDHVE